MSRDQTKGLTSRAVHGHPKFNPRPGQGLNPGPSGWQSEILPTVPTSHTQTTGGGLKRPGMNRGWGKTTVIHSF